MKFSIFSYTSDHLLYSSTLYFLLYLSIYHVCPGLDDRWTSFLLICSLVCDKQLQSLDQIVEFKLNYVAVTNNFQILVLLPFHSIEPQVLAQIIRITNVVTFSDDSVSTLRHRGVPWQDKRWEHGVQVIKCFIPGDISTHILLVRRITLCTLKKLF